MALIEIQDAYIERLRRMRPLGPRASGVERDRQIRAARRQAKLMLHNLGYSETAAAQIVKDAHDVGGSRQIRRTRLASQTEERRRRIHKTDGKTG